MRSTGNSEIRGQTGELHRKREATEVGAPSFVIFEEQESSENDIFVQPVINHTPQLSEPSQEGPFCRFHIPPPRQFVPAD